MSTVHQGLTPPARQHTWKALAGPEDRTIRAHATSIWSVAFSPDGRLIATGSHDHSVKLWDAATGEARGFLHGHDGPVQKLVFSTDSTRLATCSRDRTLKLWDVESGKELRTFRGHTAEVWAVALSPDGATLVSGSDDNTLRLWDAARGDQIAVIDDRADDVHTVAFCRDGRLLFAKVTNADGRVGVASMTVDVEVCGFSRYDLPSFRILPSELSDFLNGAPGVPITFTPRIEVEGGARDADDLPITAAPWGVLYDFDYEPALGFAPDDGTMVGDRSMTFDYLTPGRHVVVARSFSSADPGLFVEASTTVIVDVGLPTAQITRVDVSANRSRFKPAYEIRFAGIGEDPDGGDVDYHWVIRRGGEIVAEADDADGTLVVDRTGNYTFELTVTDDEGETALAMAAKSVMRIQIP